MMFSFAFPQEGYAGLTKREYFAAVALQALITKHPATTFNLADGVPDSFSEIARGAFLYADAMIDASNQSEKDMK